MNELFQSYLGDRSDIQVRICGVCNQYKARALSSFAPGHSHHEPIGFREWLEPRTSS